MLRLMRGCLNVLDGNILFNGAITTAALMPMEARWRRLWPSSLILPQTILL